MNATCRTASHSDEKPLYSELAMDRVLASGRGSRGGRGGVRAGRGGFHDRARRSEDEGYAAHAASPVMHKKGGGESSSGGKEAVRGRGGDFKEYAQAARKKDRRGREDDPADAREKPRSHRDSGHKEHVRRSCFFCRHFSSSEPKQQFQKDSCGTTAPMVFLNKNERLYNKRSRAALESKFCAQHYTPLVESVPQRSPPKFEHQR